MPKTIDSLEPTPPLRSRGEILPLTSLRMWAALFVYIHHDVVLRYGIQVGDHATPIHLAIMNEGRVGVTLFFVLSGFLLTLRYWGSLFRGTTFWSYFLKRFARIWPLYLAVCGLMFLYEWRKGYDLTWYWVFFSMTQGMFDEIKFRGIGVAWSLGVEECFYLLLPLAIVVLRRLWSDGGALWANVGRCMVALAGATFALVAVGFLLEKQNAFTIWGFFDSNRTWIPYTIFGRFVDFSFGMLVGLVFLRSRNAPLENPRAVRAGLIGGSALMLVSCYVIFYYSGITADWGKLFHLGNVIASGILIYCLCARGGWTIRVMSLPALVYLGRVSYAFYLLHMVDFMKPVYRRIDYLGLPDLLDSVACLIAATVASIIFYELIEKPCQRLILARARLVAGPAAPVASPAV